MINVVTYARVSSEDQAQKDLSVPAQQKAIRKYVESNQELNIVMEFKDEGISAYASAEKRTSFCEMISYCKAKPKFVRISSPKAISGHKSLTS